MTNVILSHSRNSVILGISIMKIEACSFCGPYLEGKQVKVSHKVLQHLVKTRVHEYLHMDLMGPMRVESIGGKWFVFACVYCWCRI